MTQTNVGVMPSAAHAGSDPEAPKAWAERIKELAAKTQATVVPFSTTEKVDGAYLEGNMLTFRGEPVIPIIGASEIK